MKLKSIIGIILIILSLALMFFWETTGREMFTTSSILVCSDNIKKGQTVGLTDFKTIRINKENVLEGALTPEKAESLEGMSAEVDMVRNQQILEGYFTISKKAKSDNDSIFVIPKEWIFSRSSALRSGDKVSIYKMPEKIKLGTFTVAFVRDASEQEVVDIEPGAKSVLDRKDSGRVISGIEIICTLNDYSRLYESVCASVPLRENETESVENTVIAEDADTPEENSKFNKTDEMKITASLLIVMEDAI